MRVRDRCDAGNGCVVANDVGLRLVQVVDRGGHVPGVPDLHGVDEELKAQRVTAMVVLVGRDLRARADTRAARILGLVPFAMTTGSRGIHVVAPLRRECSFEVVRELAWAIGERLVEGHPEQLTMESRKAQRGERIYVDVLRNGWAQTAVPPYAPRPRPGAPVALPLRWEELSDRRLRPDGATIDTAAARGDAWKGIGRHARSPARVRERLG